MKRTKWDSLWRGFADTPDEAVEEVLAACAELTRMRPVFRATVACYDFYRRHGLDPVEQPFKFSAPMLRACARAERKAIEEPPK